MSDMFPGAGAQIFRNEAGEVLGWDYPSTEPPELDDFSDAEDYYSESLYEEGYDHGWHGKGPIPPEGPRLWHDHYMNAYEQGAKDREAHDRTEQP